jgi:hypothetical protein
MNQVVEQRTVRGQSHRKQPGAVLNHHHRIIIA